MTSWQTKKLGRIGTFSKGAGIPKDSAQSGDLPAVRYGELYTSFDTFVRKTRSCIDQTTADASAKIEKGDILFAGSGETVDEIGKSAVYQLDKVGYAGGDIIIMRPDTDQDPAFLGYVLSSVARRELRRLGQGQSVVHIYRKDLESIELLLPEKPEQERIVGVLEVWDEYIEKLEQKIALKEQLKIALMQQIFSQKKRIRGFTENWQEVRLEGVASVERGKTLTSSQLVKGDYPVIAGGKSSPYKHAEYTHEDVITVSASGASAGFVAYQARRIWASDCSVIYARTSDYSTLYIYYWLHFMQDRVYGLQTGGAQPHVQPPDLRRFKILIPEKDEQLEIVAMLGLVDVEINTLESTKKQYLLQKKYLLKNLIAGTIRTPENLKRIEVQ